MVGNSARAVVKQKHVDTIKGNPRTSGANVDDDEYIEHLPIGKDQEWEKYKYKK